MGWILKLENFCRGEDETQPHLRWALPVSMQGDAGISRRVICLVGVSSEGTRPVDAEGRLRVMHVKRKRQQNVRVKLNRKYWRRQSIFSSREHSSSLMRATRPWPLNKCRCVFLFPGLFIEHPYPQVMCSFIPRISSLPFISALSGSLLLAANTTTDCVAGVPRHADVQDDCYAAPPLTWEDLRGSWAADLENYFTGHMDTS